MVVLLLDNSMMRMVIVVAIRGIVILGRLLLLLLKLLQRHEMLLILLISVLDDVMDLCWCRSLALSWKALQNGLYLILSCVTSSFWYAVTAMNGWMGTGMFGRSRPGIVRSWPARWGRRRGPEPRGGGARICVTSWAWSGRRPMICWLVWPWRN